MSICDQMYELGLPLFMSNTLEDLNIGTYSDIATVRCCYYIGVVTLISSLVHPKDYNLRISDTVGRRLGFRRAYFGFFHCLQIFFVL